MLDNNIKSIIRTKLQEFFVINKNNKKNLHLYEAIIQAVEETLIEETLRHTEGIQTQTAEILGISRTTLAKKIKEYKINYIK